MSNASLTLEGGRVASIQRWPTTKSRTWTERFLESAWEDANVVAVVAVGSAVRPNVSSVDLDLVVIAKDPAHLGYKAPIEVDLRAYAADKVDALLAGGNDLLGWTVTYGKLLLQKNNYWDLTMRRWQGKVPLPSPAIASKRADAAFVRYCNMREIGDHEAAFEQAVSCLTHLARAELSKKGRYPASRPELPQELRSIGSADLAGALESLINRTIAKPRQLAELVTRVRRPTTAPAAESA